MLLTSALFAMVWMVFRSGRSNLASTGNKLDATTRTHLRFEVLRHDLEQSQWAWAAPAPPAHEADAAGRRPLGGGSMLFAQGREYAFDAGSGRLSVGGKLVPGKYRDVRFWSQPGHLLQFVLSSDESRAPVTGKAPFRERSTLLGKVFLEAQAEEQRESHHVWETGHGWCVGGGSIHYGIQD